MTQPCGRSFDESMISGYLDGALPQREAQRTRLHIEDCAACRALLEELSEIRDAALSTSFAVPEEEEWPELPKTPIGRLSRSAGWTLLAAWLVVISVLALWRFLARTGDPFEIFLVLGLPGAFLLLFLSVLMDRLRDLKTDRYRQVQR